MEVNDGFSHGTKTLKLLVSPLKNTSRGVCVDSYFVSVSMCELMLVLRLIFSGVVKKSKKKFLLAYISNVELTEIGQWRDFIYKGGGVTNMVDFFWVDNE